MKLSLLKIVILTQLMITANSGAQNLYVLDLADTLNYSTSCGSVNAAQWSVKENFCELTTKSFSYLGDPFADPPMIAPVTVTISTTGNIGCTEIFPEGAFIRYSIDNGPWILHRAITGCEFMSGTTQITNFNLYAPAGSSIRIKISLVTISNTAKVKLQSGDIRVGTPMVATPANWTKRTASFSADQSAFQMKAFPNPSDGKNIRLNIALGKSERVEVALTDLAGHEVYSASFSDPGESTVSLNSGQALRPGAYILTGYSKDAVYKQMLIVKD